MATNLACWGLQRQVRLPARFYHLSAARETGGKDSFFHEKYSQNDCQTITFVRAKVPTAPAPGSIECASSPKFPNPPEIPEIPARLALALNGAMRNILNLHFQKITISNSIKHRLGSCLFAFIWPIWLNLLCIL